MPGIPSFGSLGDAEESQCVHDQHNVRHPVSTESRLLVKYTTRIQFLVTQRMKTNLLQWPRTQEKQNGDAKNEGQLAAVASNAREAEW